MGLYDGPCCGCKDRTVGCHGSCHGYLEWKQKYEEQKNKEYNNRCKDKFFARYVRDRNSKHMREE